jgi:hypothetical protein
MIYLLPFLLSFITIILQTKYLSIKNNTLNLKKELHILTFGVANSILCSFLLFTDFYLESEIKLILFITFIIILPFFLNKIIIEFFYKPKKRNKL